MSLGMTLYIYGAVIVLSITSASAGTLNTSVYIMFAGSLFASLSCVSELIIGYIVFCIAVTRSMPPEISTIATMP